MISIKIVLPLFLISCFILLLTALNCDNTTSYNSDTDTTITTWTKENSPYVMDTFIVEEGKKLVIEPGVTVKFKTGCTLIVKGELSAVGTETDSIRFTAWLDTSVIGYQDYWCGLSFDSCESNARLDYCIFEKYFGMEYVILCDNSSPTFSHCVFPYYVPAIESGGRIISCVNNSSPLIEYSTLTAPDYGICVACFESSNPRLFENDFYIYSSDYAVAGGGFLDGNYIHIYPDKIDTSLGTPVDEVGDGILTTTSESCINVDGITNPRGTPHF